MVEFGQAIGFSLLSWVTVIGLLNSWDKWSELGKWFEGK